MEKPNKQECNHSPYIEFDECMKIYKICLTEPYFLVDNTSFSSDNPLHLRYLRKNLTENLFYHNPKP